MGDFFGVGEIVSSVIEAGVDVGKTIYGAHQFSKGRKEMEAAIEDIKYSRPGEYAEIMRLLTNRTRGIGSRRESIEDRIRTTTASAIPGVSQLADSPVAALTAFSGVKQREQQAIADLGIQFEGIRDEAILGEVKGLEMGAGFSEKEQYWNDMYKNMIRANMGASRMGAGTNMMWGGMEGLGATALDYAGTKYLSNVYNPQSTSQLGGKPWGPGFDPGIALENQ